MNQNAKNVVTKSGRKAKKSTVYSRDGHVRGTFDVTHGQYKFVTAIGGEFHLGYVKTKNRNLAQQIANAIGAM